MNRTTKKDRSAQIKWDSQHMKTVGTRIKAEIYQDFKNQCDMHKVTCTTMIKNMIDDLIAGRSSQQHRFIFEIRYFKDMARYEIISSDLSVSHNLVNLIIQHGEDELKVRSENIASITTELSSESTHLLIFVKPNCTQAYTSICKFLTQY